MIVPDCRVDWPNCPSLHIDVGGNCLHAVHLWSGIQFQRETKPRSVAAIAGHLTRCSLVSDLSSMVSEVAGRQCTSLCKRRDQQNRFLWSAHCHPASGLSSTVPEVAGLAVDTVAQMVRTAGPAAVRPHLPLLVGSLLESLSTLEVCWQPQPIGVAMPGKAQALCCCEAPMLIWSRLRRIP